MFLKIGVGRIKHVPPFWGLTFQKLLTFSLWLTVAHYKEKHYYVGINNYLGSILTSYPYSRTAVVDFLFGPITSLNSFILPDMNSHCAASLKPHQKTIGYSHNSNYWLLLAHVGTSCVGGCYCSLPGSQMGKTLGDSSTHKSA